MNTKLLSILADFLDTVPEEKFDLNHWIDEEPNTGEVMLHQLEIYEKLKDRSCGTTGCAIGWACTIPEFVEAGLQYDPLMGQPFLQDDPKIVSFQAVAEVLGLDKEEVESLFLADNYPEDEQSPKHVATKIRLFVSLFDLGENP